MALDKVKYLKAVSPFIHISEYVFCLLNLLQNIVLLQILSFVLRVTKYRGEREMLVFLKTFLMPKR